VDRGVARIVIIVVLAVIGGLVLAYGFDDADVVAAGGSSSPTPSGTVSPTPGQTSSSQPPAGPEPQPPEDVVVMALNATSVTGLAAEATLIMEDAGYTIGAIETNAPTSGAQATSVLYRGGDGKAQNKADAKALSKDLFPGSDVGILSPDYDDIVPPDVMVVVVTGQDFADEVASEG
jgi:hypothetical protein